jgi:hypothetical protein|tara:strand:+ start:17174 stop:17398 length:225 start_codon:yes stop_codon:yes gene_type:complete
MNMISLIFILISITVVILNIILFFKIWGMTNNIKLLTNIYVHDKGIKEIEITDNDGVAIGRGIADKDGNQIKIR